MDILIYGIINSFSLALMAIGFTLVYGISRLPNFAHGALYVVTGFLVWSLIHLLKLNYVLSIIVALVIMGLVGAAIYRFVLIRVRGMATSEIIATYALGLAVLEFLRWAGFKGMTYTLPVFIEGSISIRGIPVDFQRIIVIGIGIVVVSFMWLFTHFNKTGLAFRGMAQDEHAAMMLGIDSDWMAVIAMAMGSVLAGLAAIALLPLGNIVVEAGYNVLILSIAVCIVGGSGQLGRCDYCVVYDWIPPNHYRCLHPIAFSHGRGSLSDYHHSHTEAFGTLWQTKGVGGKSIETEIPNTKFQIPNNAKIQKVKKVAPRDLSPPTRRGFTASRKTGNFLNRSLNHHSSPFTERGFLGVLINLLNFFIWVIKSPQFPFYKTRDGEGS